MIPRGVYVLTDQRRGVRNAGHPIAYVEDDGHGVAWLVYTEGNGSASIRFDDDDPHYIGEDGYYVLPTGAGPVQLRWPDQALFDELAPEFPGVAWPTTDSDDQRQVFLRSLTIDTYLGP